MKISDVEKKVGITKANIRYYEKEGLLSPLRDSENNYREYTLEDIRHLEQIKVLRALGISISEIRQLDSGVLTFDEVIVQRLEQLRKDEENLMKTRCVCEFILQNHISYETVDESLLESTGEAIGNWQTELQKIWKEDIIKEKITKKQLNRNLMFMTSAAYLINAVIAELFGGYLLDIQMSHTAAWLILTAGTGIIAYLTVLFTADVRIHAAAYFASVITLTPFIICVHYFMEQFLLASVIRPEEINGIELSVFWLLIFAYVCLIFCLTEKYGSQLNDLHIIGIAGICTGIVTVLSGIILGHWVTPVVMFLMFTLYIGLSWKNIIKGNQ